MTNHVCKQCNNTFQDKRSQAKFCCLNCYYKSMKGIEKIHNRKRVIKECVVCKKSFEVRMCHSHVKTCSIKCGGITRRGKYPKTLKNRIEKKCVNCLKTFETIQSNNNIFCTRKCYTEFKSLNVKYPQNQRLQKIEWIKIRREVIKRDKVCTKCFKDGKEVHHIIPYSISGDDSLENLTLLCKSCHLKTHLEMWENEKKLSINNN